MFAEAVTAVNGAIILRLKGDFGFLAAVRADDGKHLALFAAVAVALTFVAAVAATHGLVLEALFGVEFLFACAEDEFFSAVFAHEGFVFKSHKKNLLTTQKILAFGAEHGARANMRELYHALQKKQAV